MQPDMFEVNLPTRASRERLHPGGRPTRRQIFRQTAQKWTSAGVPLPSGFDWRPPSSWRPDQQALPPQHPSRKWRTRSRPSYGHPLSQTNALSCSAVFRSHSPHHLSTLPYSSSLPRISRQPNQYGPFDRSTVAKAERFIVVIWNQSIPYRIEWYHTSTVKKDFSGQSAPRRQYERAGVNGGHNQCRL